MSRLRVEAMTAIDISGKPFNSPKLKLDLANKKNSRSLEDEYSEYAVLSQIAEEEAALEEEFIKDLENAEVVEAMEIRDLQERESNQDVLDRGSGGMLYRIHEATAGGIKPSQFDSAVDSNTRRDLKQGSSKYVNKNQKRDLDDILLELSREMGLSYDLVAQDYVDYVSSRESKPELYTKDRIANFKFNEYTRLLPNEILAETKNALKSINPMGVIDRLKARGVTEYQMDIIKKYAENVSKVKQEQQEMILGSDILKDLRKEFKKGCDS